MMRHVFGWVLVLFMLATPSGCFEAQRTYEFTFDTNGGEPIAPLIVLRNEWDGSIPVPIRAGYAFNGWYVDAALTNLFDTQDFIDGDERSMILYAKWVPEAVTVTVEHYQENPDGSYTLYETTTVAAAYGETCYAPGIIYDYYRQNVAHPDRVASGMPSLEIPLVLRLHYERITFVATFYTYGAAYVQYDLKFGTTLIPPADPIREGYVFDGWYDDSFYMIPLSIEVMPTRNEYFYAKWIPLPHDLVFIENGGADLTDRVVDVGTEVTLPVPTRTGYAFGGWYTDAECITSPFADGTAMPDADTTLYAKWTIRQYTIYFQENDGSELADLTLEFESAIQLPEPPIKAHYVFAGWFIDEALTVPNPYTTMTPYNFNLYAKWLPLMVTITYVTNGAAAIDPLVAQSGSSYALASPERADHIFAGWFVDPELTTQHVNTGAMPGSDMTLYAKWYGMTYMVHFDTMGGPYVQDLSLPSGSPLSLPTPTRAGFTFVGWYDAMLTTPYTGTVMPEGNLVLYAKWAPV